MIKLPAFILLFLCCGASASAKTNYYPGMVHLETGTYWSSGPAGDLSKQVSNFIVFDFYKHPGDSEAVHTLSFYFDWAHIPRREKIWEDDYTKWFSPMVMDTFGYYNLYLTCRSKKGDWLEVIVNEKTKETLWIKSTFFVQFLAWNKLSTRNRWVTVSAKNTIYTQPDTTSPTVQVAVNCFEIKRVKGDWMKISNGDEESCNSFEEPQVKNVWILFRSPGELLIDVTVY